MLAKYLAADWREHKADNWARTGLLVFLTSFIWSPSQDGLIGIYSLAFFIPMLLVLPWRKPDWQSFGGWPTLMALFFGVYATLSVLWGGQPDSWAYFSGVLLLLTAWLYGVSWLNARGALDLGRILKYLLLAGVLVGPSVVWGFYRNHDLSERLNAWTIAHNPIVLAQYYSVLSLLALLESWRRVRWQEVGGYFALSLILQIPVLLTQSRGPVLAFLCTLVIAVVLIRPRPKVLLLQLLPVVAALILVISQIDIMALLLSREQTISFRKEVWSLVWNSWLDHPGFGIGLTKDTKINIPGVEEFHHAHNVFLDTLYRTGALGLVFLLGHLFLVMRGIKKYRNLAPLYLWLLLGCFCFVTDGRIMFWQLDVKWFLYWIPAGLIAAIQSSLISKGSSVEKPHGQ